MKCDPVAPAALIDMIDMIAEAKTSLLIATGMPLTNERRATEIQRLEVAIVSIRAIVSRNFNTPDGVPRSLLIEIRTCELGLEKLYAESLACDKCCGHANEDGRCQPIRHDPRLS